MSLITPLFGAITKKGIFFTPNFWSESACLKSPERLLCPVLYGTFLMCFIIKARLLSSLSPFWFQDLEAKCQALSKEIIWLQEKSVIYENGGVFGGIFMSQTLWVAKATRETRELYDCNALQTGGRATAGDTMIEGWKFQAWCNAMGRRTTRLWAYPQRRFSDRLTRGAAKNQCWCMAA